MVAVEERVSVLRSAAGGAGSRPGSGDSRRVRPRMVSVGAFRGVLALGEQGWVVDNDSEVRLLEALRGERGAKSRNWELRYVAAWHTKVPVSALRRLVRDESSEVRAAAAHAVSAPASVLEVLGSGPSNPELMLTAT